MPFRAWVTLVLGLTPAAFGFQTTKLTGLKIHAVPQDRRVRPLHSASVLVMVYGEIKAQDGSVRTGRIRRDGARVRIVEADGGWLSKPYRFQETEPEPFADAQTSGLGAILGGLASQFTMLDAVLYTAPERPGRYTIEATLEGHTASATIDVDPGAPATRPEEAFQFEASPPDPSPYRALAERYAPLVAQETWFDPKADYLARFDFDGDTRGDNNWENAPRGSSQAYVYYAAMETDTHWFLIYNFFHPRDYSDKCVAGTCHENDNEGIILTVQKDGSQFGRLQVMETLAHNNVYTFTLDRSLRNGVHNIEGEIPLQDGRPIVFIESGGHGNYGPGPGFRYVPREARFTAGTGVTYTYKGVAERPRHPNDRLVGYDLLPIYHHWWLRSGSGRGEMFDAYFRYEPFGGRPGSGSEIPGSFLGRVHGANKAKPFWGWHDERTRRRKVLNTGQWGLDPAYAVSQNVRFPGDQRVSLQYTHNPFLGIGELPPADTAAAVPAAAALLGDKGPGGDPAPPSPDAPKGPLLDLSGDSGNPPPAVSGTVEIAVHVDGQVDLLIRGETVIYDVLSGQPARPEHTHFSAALPQADFAQFRVQKTAGRGEVRLMEFPNAGNDYTARIRVDDPDRASALYRIRIDWRRR